jgi:hypothetical protein
MSEIDVSDGDYKSPGFTDIPGSKSIGAAEKPLSLLQQFPDPPDFGDALEAVEGLANAGESFLDVIQYITREIPVDLGPALSPLFVFVDFDEIPLLQLADSPLSAIIRDTFIQSNDDLLLLSCANLVAACACVSKACLNKFIQSGLHSSLFACLPLLESLDPIAAVLDALTIIWKRLSWVHLSITLESEQLEALFSIARPLSLALRIPFVRLLYSLLAYGSLDEVQADRVDSLICAILFRCFHVQAEAISALIQDAVAQEELGQMTEIAFLLNQNEGNILVANYKAFEDLVSSVHLLLPGTITRLLLFFDRIAEYCDDTTTAEFLERLPCYDLIEILQADDPPLVEAVLNIISLAIERQCDHPNYIVEFVLPRIIGVILDSIRGDSFPLKQAAIRFVHAVVGRLNWVVLPHAAFEIYMMEVTGLMPSPSPQECIWFLDGLLFALRVVDPEFTDYVTSVCNELNIWDIFEEISQEDIVVEALCNRIEEARKCMQEDVS